MPTRTEIAAALGVTPALVTRYGKAGMPTNDIAAARVWKSANVRQRVSGSMAKKKKPAKKVATKRAARAKPPPPNPYQDARTAQAIADAEDAQLRVLERRGVLVHVDVHRARVAQHLSALKDAFLQMPARLAAVLAAESDEAKCHSIVQDEIFSVLARLTEPT